MNDYIFWAIWAVAGLIMLIYYMKRKRGYIITPILGIAALLACHYYGDFLGFTPELNVFNVAIAGVLGVPGMVLMWFAGVFI
jgi:hypothetical protein